MNSVKAACIQMEISNCKKEENISKALSMAENAVKQGAEILVFPEVFSTGFCYGDMGNSAEDEKGQTVVRMCEFSRINHCVLIFSIIEKKVVAAAAIYYNLGICIENGEIVGTYRKTHPFKREKQYFSPGDSIHPISLRKRELNIGLQICYELRFPEVARKLVLEGADLLVTIAEFPAPRDHIWRSLVIARSIENQIPHIACNRVGKSTDSSYFGGSMIVDSLGEVFDESFNSERIIYGNIDLTKSRDTRKLIPVLEDRRPDIY
ncbi:MAG: nitrilase-related carbon-nitrogen hydrolase [Methanolobus sp.]